MSENKHPSSLTTISTTVEYESLMLSYQKLTSESTYRQIVANLTAHYPYIQQYYNLNEDAVADKIIEIAQRICSKI